MKKNMGPVDKIIRVMIATAIAILYLTGQIKGITATALFLLAAIFTVTSLIGFCPLYLLFGMSTKKSDKNRRTL